MRIVVPFAASTPKTRLQPVLSPAERSTFAKAMLGDVLTALTDAGYDPTVLATTPLDLEAEAYSLESGVLEAVSVAVDERPLTEAVNARLGASASDPVAVVMADLALATPDALERLFATDADVAITPGRGSGTNALVVRHPDVRVDYHGTSYLDHCENAQDVGASLEMVDSFRLATDIDEPADLVEVLVHGEDDARAPAALREFGFELAETDGRVTVTRRESPASK
ncbi:2-phospho-L-lactate guanylyltransferase [Natronolimnobius sp. AArcel1]|uniref:2-phospho-L-lactate guanylyltransferase n=1 Tax=Natronolimnobius sp. AArcel1 TaxID=1679093 RepID=UPI0013EA58AC|nr:2-phospho-L-lactate guanylyltransferase [Natronolimnobius sp. AArcel1]NGM68283.1 2-phospho-L-lactate guanylyltransferase [Natronolimnobius sp. AArcel1]